MKHAKQRNILIAIIIILVLSILVLLNNWPDKSTTDDYVHNHNIEALKDSIRTYKTKNNELVYEKMALITKYEDLGKYNKGLESRIKYLEDRLLMVSDIDVIIVHDTIWVVPEIDKDNDNIYVNNDSTIKATRFTWVYSDTFNANNYRTIEGSYMVQLDTSLNITTDSFLISKDLIGMSFTTGLTENKNDQVEIFIKSDYPGFRPTTIEGALFDPRESKVINKFFPPKKWGLSLYGGYGLYYDPANSHAGHGIQIGIGLSYDIVQWRRKK